MFPLGTSLIFFPHSLGIYFWDGRGWGKSIRGCHWRNFNSLTQKGHFSLINVYLWFPHKCIHIGNGQMNTVHPITNTSNKQEEPLHTGTLLPKVANKENVMVTFPSHTGTPKCSFEELQPLQSPQGGLSQLKPQPFFHTCPGSSENSTEDTSWAPCSPQQTQKVLPGQPGVTAKNSTSILWSRTWKPGSHRDTAAPQASVQLPVRKFYQHHVINFPSFPASPRPCRLLSSSMDGQAAAVSITPRVTLPQRALFQGMLRRWLRPHIHTSSSKCHWHRHPWGLPFKIFFHRPTESMPAPKLPRAQRPVVISAAPGGSRAAAHLKLLPSAHPSSPLWMATGMLSTSRVERSPTKAGDVMHPVPTG